MLFIEQMNCHSYTNQRTRLLFDTNVSICRSYFCDISSSVSGTAIYINNENVFFELTETTLLNCTTPEQATVNARAAQITISSICYTHCYSTSGGYDCHFLASSSFNRCTADLISSSMSCRSYGTMNFNNAIWEITNINSSAHLRSGGNQVGFDLSAVMGEFYVKYSLVSRCHGRSLVFCACDTVHGPTLTISRANFVRNTCELGMFRLARGNTSLCESVFVRNTFTETTTRLAFPQTAISVARLFVSGCQFDFASGLVGDEATPDDECVFSTRRPATLEHDLLQTEACLQPRHSSGFTLAGLYRVSIILQMACVLNLFM